MIDYRSTHRAIRSVARIIQFEYITHKFLTTDQNSEAGVSKTGDADDDDSGDDEESGKQENDKDKKNPEELGQGYEKIGA